MTKSTYFFFATTLLSQCIEYISCNEDVGAFASNIVHVSYSDDTANTTLNWFNLEIYPTPIGISEETVGTVVGSVMEVLDREFADIYYNFKNFKFEDSDNIMSNPISRQRENTVNTVATQKRENNGDDAIDRSGGNLRRRTSAAASLDDPSSSIDSRIEQSDKSRYLQDILNMELGSAVTFAGGSAIFLAQPVQSQQRVDKAIITTLNSPSVNPKVINALLDTGNPDLSSVYFVRAVPFPSEAPSLSPSGAPSTFPSSYPSVSPSASPTSQPVLSIGNGIASNTGLVDKGRNPEKPDMLLFPPIAAAAVFFVVVGLTARIMKKKRDEKNAAADSLAGDEASQESISVK